LAAVVVVRPQGEFEVGPDETVVAFLGIDDEVALTVIKLRDDRNARHARQVVTKHVLARVRGILRARAPERIACDLRDVAILRQQVNDRYVHAACPVEQTLVGRDHLSRNLRRGRHRRDVHVEMATMQIDRDDGRPGMIDTEIHADTSFGFMGRM
jgi:hypothetical protein